MTRRSTTARACPPSPRFSRSSPRSPARPEESAPQEARHVRFLPAPARELLGLEPAVVVDEMAAVRLEDGRHVPHDGCTARWDADHDMALANRCLVPREVGRLVGPAELDDPEQAPAPAAPPTAGVECR